MSSSQYSMEIASTMGNGSLGRELDLSTFIKELNSVADGGVESNFSSGSMVTVRLERDGPAYTFYRTGSFQIRGARSVEQLKQAEERLRKTLSRLEVNTPEYQFSHVTSVFVADLDISIDLQVLSIALGLESTEYEPEQFPAAIHRPPDQEVTMLIFSTGKIIIAGTTDDEEAASALDYLQNQIAVSGM